MEENATKKIQRTLLLRRFIAIVLTGLAILAMFLPMLCLNGEVKEMLGDIKAAGKKEGYKSIETIITEKLPEEYAAELTKGYAPTEYVYFMRDKVESLAKKVVVPAYKVIADNRITLMEMNSAAGLPYKAINILAKRMGDLEDILDRSVANGLDQDKADAVLNDFNTIKKFKTAADIAGIVPYVLFFIMLALGAAAIVMYFLNRGKAFGVLFAVCAILTALIMIGGIVVPKMVLDNVTINADGVVKDIVQDCVEIGKGLVPGVGLIMLPIFALAAVIVYKKDKSYTGIFPKREKKPEPVYEGPVAAAGPVNEPVVNASGWVCTHCGYVNEEVSRFCCGCGMKKEEAPAPTAPAPAKFCSSCGARQDEGAAFCLNCGAKIE